MKSLQRRVRLHRRQRDVAAPAGIAARSQIVEQALSWLPSDTETVTAANGPFLVPDLSWDPREKPNGNGSDEIADTFRGPSCGAYRLQKGIHEQVFKRGESALSS